MGTWWITGLAVAALGAAPLAAQESVGIRADFSAADLQGEAIVLIRPTVWVGAQSTGGTPEPNAEWTDTARALLAAELQQREALLGRKLVAEPEVTGADGTLLAGYRALFATVARAAMTYQFFRGNRLPTHRHAPFAWTLGPGTQRIAALTGARYALFVDLRDAYGSTGRKLFQIAAAGLVGLSITSGLHRGFAGLVYLRSGDLVWLRADQAMGGDVRTAEGMRRRVGQLLEQMPQAGAASVPPTREGSP